MNRQTYYGIWCFDENDNKGDWLRNFGDEERPILAFETKKLACQRAARNYGFLTYTEAKRKGWAEVRPLSKN